MSVPEPDEIARWRAALASLAERPGWPPADAERIFAALHGDLPAEERRAVIEELVRNPDAAAVWRLARELPPEERLPARPARSWARAATWSAMAATVLLAIAFGWQFGDRQVSQEPAYRSVVGRSIESLLPPDAPLPRAQPVLRWTPVEGARYRIRALTADLEVLEEVDDLRTPEHRLGAVTLSRVPSGGELLWQVEARVHGEPLLVSPTFTVRLE